MMPLPNTIPNQINQLPQLNMHNQPIGRDGQQIIGNNYLQNHMP